jgi:hypothetical protein
MSLVSNTRYQRTECHSLEALLRSRRSSNCRRGCCLFVGVYAGRLLQGPTHKLSNLRKRSSELRSMWGEQANTSTKRRQYEAITRDGCALSLLHRTRRSGVLGVLLRGA